jgi:tripeptide aminopeptidase
MDTKLQKTLYNRLQRYVKIDTQSNPNVKQWPSNPGQLKLGKILALEMKKIGLKKISIDKNGYVMGELPANTKNKVPVIAFLAHLDTAWEVSGKNVKPQIHRHYKGGNIVINKKEKVILRISDSPELKDCVGHDIVTASGNTLLGGDNKAGIAIVLTAMEELVKNPHIKHGKIKVCFTPDEEIHRSSERLNVKKLGAKYAYTFDGSGIGIVEDENFNAAGFEIEIKGVNYHPGYAKNVMVNAVTIAADIISAWPETLTPEHTEGREGFVWFLGCNSTVENAKISGLVRDFDIRKLRNYEKFLKAIIKEKKAKYPKAKITLHFKDQYRNMKEVLDKHHEVVKNLQSAAIREGIVPVMNAIRGGTDGSKLSFKGVPTPNFSMGGGNFHGKYEWISIQGMEKSAKVLVALVQQWEQNP